MSKTGYKNCVYDRFNKCIWLKEVGDVDFKKYPYTFDYYAPDPTGKSIYTDYHGNKVVRKTALDRSKLQSLIDSGVKLCESDISEVTKFLHEKYDAIADEIETSADDFRICIYDIETQTSCPQNRRSVVKVKRVDTGEELTGILNELDDFVHTNDYLWWDETKNKYVKFLESCFYVSEFPKPSEAKYPINVFTCYSTVDKQTHTWGLFDYTGNSEIVQNYRSFTDEYEMLTDFVNWFHKQKFDLFTGWNTDGFDLEYIITRIRNLELAKGIAKPFTNKKGETEYDFRLTKKFSPFNREPSIRHLVDKKGKPTGVTAISILGLYTNDYMEMYKKFITDHWQSFALNYICDQEIGEGKLAYEGQIYETYKRDWNRYVEYNVNDVLLNKKLDDKRKVFDIVIPYCTECMITLDKCQSMIAAVEGYMLKFMHKKNIRMNDIDRHNKRDWWHEQGMFKVKEKDGNITYQNCDYERQLYDFEDFAVKAGYCYAYPGRYKWVISGDIQSSYPHQIMMYNISPEVKVINPTKEQIESGEVIQSEINGVGFRRTEHALLPDIIRQVFSERLAAKAELKKALHAGNSEMEVYWDKKQRCKKTIINSCYGVCLNENFHLYDIDCARAITRGGRDTVRYLMNCNNRYYTSKQFLNDAKKYFPSLKLTVNGKDYYYKAQDEITILRNDVEMKILAKDFNEETDLLGVV